MWTQLCGAHIDSLDDNLVRFPVERDDLRVQWDVGEVLPPSLARERRRGRLARGVGRSFPTAPLSSPERILTMSPVRKAAAAIIVGQPRAAAAGAARAPSESALALAKRPSSKQETLRAISAELAREIALCILRCWSRLGSGPHASSLRLSRRAMMREQPACPAPASSSSTSPRTPPLSRRLVRVRRAAAGTTLLLETLPDSSSPFSLQGGETLSSFTPISPRQPS